MVSCGFAAGSVLTLFFVIWSSFHEKGNGSVYLGSAGILAFMLSITAAILAVQSFREEESFRFFPRLSVLCAFITILIWIGLFLAGIML